MGFNFKGGVQFEGWDSTLEVGSTLGGFNFRGGLNLRLGFNFRGGAQL